MKNKNNPKKAILTLTRRDAMQKQKEKRSFLTATIFMAAILFMISGTAVQEVKAQEPLLGEIKMVGFNFAPRGWAFCDGQLLPISQNSALFSLLGTTFGGDGRITFALPDLRGRFAMHPGNGPGLTSRSWGAGGGRETETLTTAEIPAHTHTATVNAFSSEGDSTTPDNNTWAKSGQGDPDYYTGGYDADMAADSVKIEDAGGDQPHNNMPPFRAVYYIIALQGIFPSRN
jgi:microcystin-dependent protein